MDFLQVDNINMQQQENGFALNDISFVQQRFQKIAVAGETGSGKSTLLKIIAGLVQPTSGKVLFEKKKVVGPDFKLIPGHPGIAYLSQYFELPNFLKVSQVLEYANMLTDEEAQTLYEVCHINHLMERRTDQLSGGEKQRTALARLLITSPKLLLLDEPFSNLDVIHKNILKKVINDIGERLKITCIMISHDPTDTLSWADEILVLKDGELLQQADPKTIYNQPVNEYCAALFGNYHLLTNTQVKAFEKITGRQSGGGNFIRPEYLALTKSGGVTGNVTSVRFMGSFYETEVLLLDALVTIKSMKSSVAKGEKVGVIYVGN